MGTSWGTSTHPKTVYNRKWAKAYRELHHDRVLLSERKYRERIKLRLGVEGIRKRQKKYNLWSKFRLTLEEYTRLADLQLGVCAICGHPPSGTEKEKYLHVDHDHSTGKVRGLLCRICNNALIALETNPEWGIRASAYLLRHQKERLQ